MNKKENGKMRNKENFRGILMGMTTYGEIVFANVERRMGSEFSASFSCVSPIVWDDNTASERVKSLVDDIDSEYKLSLLERFDCKPSELVDEILDESEVEDIIDISLYSECIELDDKEVYFESSSCGQHDITQYDYEFMLNEELFNMIIECWHKYHLKSIPDYEWSKLQKLLVTYEDIINEEEQIKEWLENSENIYL